MSETTQAGDASAEAPDTADETARDADTAQADSEVQEKHPLYPRLLHLQHIHPNAWQRAVLGEGMAVLGALLAMADLASAWLIVVLPVAVAVVVKCHDLLAGLLATAPEPDDPAD
jgi:hypothetical protein